MADHTDVPPEAKVLELLTGGWVAQAIHTAAVLGVADALDAGPATAEALAARTSTHAPSLYRLLRALAGVGLCVEDERGRFTLTPAGATLRRGVPGSTRGLALFWSAAWHEQAWAQLAYSVRTGEPAFDRVFGAPLFDWLRDHPGESAVFNDAMTSLSGQVAVAVAAAYPLAEVETLVDVGGGHGFLLATLLHANPRLRGILFDLPEVTADAPAALTRAGVADRCQVRSGSFFESIPEADAYIMKHIIHDWDDERSAAILRGCRRAMRPGGRVLVVEHIVPKGNDPHFVKLLDLEMLALTPKGQERTEEEFRTLFRTADLELTRVVPTESQIYVLEARARA